MGKEEALNIQRKITSKTLNGRKLPAIGRKQLLSGQKVSLTGHKPAPIGRKLILNGQKLKWEKATPPLEKKNPSMLKLWKGSLLKFHS